MLRTSYKHNLSESTPGPRKVCRFPVLAAAMITFAMVLAPGAHADGTTPSLEEMWKIIQQQQVEIQSLKEQNARLLERVGAQNPQADAVTVEAPEDTPYESLQETDAPGPVSGSRFDIYGTVMLDMGYDFRQNDPDWYDVVRPTKLPAYKNEFAPNGNLFTSVRQSRLGVQSWTPTRFGDLHTIFEFDLFGVGADAGQTTFHLRQAWGEIGQFGAGQTWSTFMDPDMFPNSIEFWGPSGIVAFRNIQLRWTPWEDGGSNFMVSLERPGASGDQGKYDDDPGLVGVKGRFPLPDLSAHYRLQQDWGHVQVAGILRRIDWEDVNQDPYDLSGGATGWGIDLSTNLNLGRHVFRGSLVYGEGIQNYMNDATSDIGIEDNFQDPLQPFKGKILPVLGLTAFLDLNWNDRWSSTIGYSMLDMDNSDGQSPAAFAKGQYALANILYHPTTTMLLGPELQWAKRDNYSDGFSSDDFRIQFSVRYSFSKSFGSE